MRFVDRYQGGLTPRQHFRKTRDAQPLGRDEQELQAAFQIVDADLARVGAAAAGVNALGAQASFAELGDLVFHQRDQRADHQRDPAPSQPGQLVAERFAGAGRHHQQHVFALGSGFAGLLLMRAEAVEAEGGVQ